MQTYSPYFQTLHDETAPTGHLGRGTHYSVLRCITWKTSNYSASKPLHQDIAVIWDEDHDTRIIQILEELYLQGLLIPVLFIGERKGSIHLVYDTPTYPHHIESVFKDYTKMEQKFINFVEGDSWSFTSSPFPDPNGLISDDDEKVIPYLECINMLWRLGPKQPFLKTKCDI